MKKLLAPMIATALILSAGVSFAEDAPKPDGNTPPHGEKHFGEADTDKDGFISKDEMKARQAKHLDEMFSDADTNKDGKLSHEEMKAHREKMKAKWKEHREERKDRKAGGKGLDGGSPESDKPDAPEAQ